MNSFPIPAGFRRSAMAMAVSTLYLLPVTGSQAAEPGPIGAEFQVNTTTALGQYSPKVAMAANGDSVVVWETQFSASDTDIHAQRYSANGQALGAELVIADTGVTETQPGVAMDASGDFVVTWAVNYGDASSGYDIRARRYNAAGEAQGPGFGVNTKTNKNQTHPAVAIDADGDFVLVWETFGYEIHAQRYDAAGLAQGTEFQVNTRTDGSQFFPAIALDADGDFVVAWTTNAIGSYYDIRAQRYNAAGKRQGEEFRVNTLTSAKENDPAVALDPAGDFVVAWTSSPSGSGAYSDIHAQRYDAAGLAQGGEFQVNTSTTFNQTAPAIALDAAGDLAVAWQSGYSGHYDIRAQRYNAANLAQGGEFQVNALSAGNQFGAGIALDADGDFVVAWQSNATGDFDIRARRYQGPNPVDMTLMQTDSADPAPVGSPLSYTLNVSNLQSPSTLTGIAAIDNAIGLATGLRVVDTLPAGSSFLSASGSNWKCKQKAGKVICDYRSPLASAATADPITLTLTPPNSPGALIRNKATVSANQVDEVSNNNSETEKTLLQ